jgi:bifunctional DNase/RNase
MKEQRKCSVEGCDSDWAIHVTEISERRSVNENGYCRSHGPIAIDEYLAKVRSLGRPEASTSDVGLRFQLGLLVFDYISDVHKLYLYEVSGSWLFLLEIGYYEAAGIYSAVREQTAKRPLTHPAMLSIITALHGVLQHVVIDRIHEQERYYSATARISQGEQAVLIDLRPTDALALALYAQVPVFVSREVVAKLPS